MAKIRDTTADPEVKAPKASKKRKLSDVETVVSQEVDDKAARKKAKKEAKEAKEAAKAEKSSKKEKKSKKGKAVVPGDAPMVDAEPVVAALEPVVEDAEEKPSKKSKKDKKSKKSKSEDESMIDAAPVESVAEPEPTTNGAEEKASKKSKKDKKSKKSKTEDEPVADSEPVAEPEPSTNGTEKKFKKSKKVKSEEVAAEEPTEEKPKKSKKSKKVEAKETAEAKPKKENKSKKAKTEAEDDAAEAGEEADGSAKREKFICFIGNLPYTATTDDIHTHFAALKPTSVRLLTQKEAPTKSRGIAFIEFGDFAHMKTCLSKFHHTDFNDGKSEVRKINVELTAGGGGKTPHRQDKIKEKNTKLNEQRTRRIQAEEEAKKNKPAGGEKEKPAVEVEQEDYVHPSRRVYVPGRRS